MRDKIGFSRLFMDKIYPGVIVKVFRVVLKKKKNRKYVKQD